MLHSHLMAHACGVRVHFALLAASPNSPAPLGSLHGRQRGIAGCSVDGGDILASYHAADMAGLLLCLTGTGVSAEDLIE